MTITPLGAPISRNTRKVVKFVIGHRPDLLGLRFGFRFGHICLYSGTERTEVSYRVEHISGSTYQVMKWSHRRPWMGYVPGEIPLKFTITGV